MATIIDSLILELGIDPKNLDQGAKESVGKIRNMEDQFERSGKNVEKSAKKMDVSLGAVQNRVLSLLAIFTAGKGIKTFVSEITSANAETGWLARTLDTSIETLSTWRNMATLVGGSAAGMTSSVQGLVSQFQTFSLTGESSVIPYFRALGVQISDAKGNMRSMDDIMLDLADRFEGMDPARAAAFGRFLGFDQGTINLLLEGRKSVEEMIKAQRELGVVTKEDAEASQALMRSWGMLSLSSEAAGRSLMTSITPAILGVLDALLAVSKWAREHPNLIRGALIGIAAALGAIAIAMAATAALVTAGVAAVIGAFALLYDDWKAWMDGGKSLFGGFYDFLSKLFKAIKSLFTGSGEEIREAWGALFDDIKENFADLIDYIWQLGPKILDAFKGAFSSASKWVRERLGSIGDAIFGGGAGAPAGEEGVSGSAYPEAQSDIDSLMRKGWSEAQAKGIVANLQRESSGRKDAVGDGGKAYGLAQWHPDRQAAFRKWSGKDIRSASREEQLAFIDYEMRVGNEQFAGRKLMQAKSAREAAAAVARYYERPANIAGEARARGDIAASFGAMGAGGVASMTAANDYSRTSSTSIQNETNVGEIKVYSQATDAAGIARDIKPALERNSFAQQANYGPS